MPLINRINSRAKTDESTGFGTNGSMYGGRLVNRDGTPNIEKRGISFLERYSWYHTMLMLPGWKFFVVLLVTYVTINLAFGLIYFLIGIDHLAGVIASTDLQKFSESFFFSTQTFTTVGYGRISPVGFWTSSIATFESFLGLMNFAIATGLFYGRFSRPQAFLKFSENALIAPYKDGIAFMFRLAPYKNNQLTDAEVKINLAMTLEENGKPVNRFFPLNLELSKINALNLNWTIVHPIDDKSPFFQLSKEDLVNNKAEVLVFVKAFDDSFSNTVVARTSYMGDEFIYGAKFIPMYHRSNAGNRTVIELDKLNSYELVDISYVVDAQMNAGIK